MDGCEEILLDQLLADQDGVFVIVALPWHEGNQHVPPKRQLTAGRAGPVGDDLARCNLLAPVDDRLLVDAGALVRTRELDQMICFFALLAVHGLDSDLVSRYPGDEATKIGLYHNPGVLRHPVLDPGPHQGGLGAHQGHCLALHVRSHQGAVGVIVLQEGNQGGSNADHLLRGNVHVVHI